MSKDGRMIISAANYLRIADYLVEVTLKYAQARDALQALRRVAMQLRQRGIYSDGDHEWCTLCDSPAVILGRAIQHAHDCPLIRMETILADASRQHSDEAVDDQAGMAGGD